MAIGQCAYTGRPIESTADGIWDDGEWISWDYISQVEYLQELKSQFPNTEPEIVQVFQDLVDAAVEYWGLTGRHLDIFGELGELYAEIHYGLKRHSPNAQGSDGRLGDDFVEVKTISPYRASDAVKVKRAGHFSKLVVVKINEDYEFASRMIDRRKLRKGDGKFASVKFGDMEPGDL